MGPSSNKADLAGSLQRLKDHNKGLLPDYKIIPERRLVFVKFSGQVTVKKIAWYAECLRADPSFDPHFSEIVDIREVQGVDLDGPQMIEVADKIDPFAHEAKRAFVVSTAVQEHGARMHQILRAAKENMAIFHSLEEAERWILH